MFIEHDPNSLGFRGLHVACVKVFFKIKHQSIKYPYALVMWFSAIGDTLYSNTGMWMVEPDVDQQGRCVMSVIHLDSILWAAHLIGIAGNHTILYQLKHTNSLEAFRAFYVNKYIDHHAHEIAW